jgi:hypothetical protein
LNIEGTPHPHPQQQKQQQKQQTAAVAVTKTTKSEDNESSPYFQESKPPSKRPLLMNEINPVDMMDIDIDIDDEVPSKKISK